LSTRIPARKFRTTARRCSTPRRQHVGNGERVPEVRGVSLGASQRGDVRVDSRRPDELFLCPAEGRDRSDDGDGADRAASRRVHPRQTGQLGYRNREGGKYISAAWVRH
jgi:hypothetical protein